MPNPGYQGTRDFNPQMGQQVPRNPNPQADELLLKVTEMMKNQFGLKPKGMTFVQTLISRMVWFGRSSYKLQAPKVRQVHRSRQYKHNRTCQSVSYIIGWSISSGCPSGLFFLLIPVRASLHLVLVTTSQLHCQLGWPREEVSYIFLHQDWRKEDNWFGDHEIEE